eukprot:1515993-Pleurochrysis_carterae.AAC.2
MEAISQRSLAMHFSYWEDCREVVARLLCRWFARANYHASAIILMRRAQLLFKATHVVDGSVDAIDGEMTEAS